jgi:hypothetical protein
MCHGLATTIRRNPWKSWYNGDTPSELIETLDDALIERRATLDGMMITTGRGSSIWIWKTIISHNKTKTQEE